MKLEITVVDYKPGHLDVIPRLRFMSMSKDEVAARLESMKENGVIKTLILHDLVIGIVGLVKMGPGVAECFSVLSENITGIPILFHKTVKKILQAHMDLMKLHRIQCTVREGFDAGIKWANSLGFQAECLMKKYGPDQSNMWLFARTL